MNNILVNSEVNLDKEKYEFIKDTTVFYNVQDLKKEVFFEVKNNSNVIINILAKDVDLTFNIRIGSSSNLTINCMILNGNINTYTVLGEKYSKFYYNYSVISNKNSHNIIEVKHIASDTTSYLRNHGFSTNKANIIFDVSGYIDKSASKCISKQDNQIIEKEDSLSRINPNLYIDNYDVEASHSAYVGEFKEDELFYLMSRGISKSDAEFLLLKSFILGSFSLSDDILEKYTYQVIKYFNREV